jgi:hypothetical protein
MPLAQIEQHLDGMPASQIRKLRSYEAKHKNRKGMLQKMDRLLARH